MSIETLTGDEFIELTQEDHEEALGLYAEATVAEAAKLPALEVGTTAHESVLDRLARILTLRKVHQVRLEEMKEDEREPLGTSVMEQYQQNDRQPLLH